VATAGTGDTEVFCARVVVVAIHRFSVTDIFRACIVESTWVSVITGSADHGVFASGLPVTAIGSACIAIVAFDGFTDTIAVDTDAIGGTETSIIAITLVQVFDFAITVVCIAAIDGAWIAVVANLWNPHALSVVTFVVSCAHLPIITGSLIE